MHSFGQISREVAANILQPLAGVGICIDQLSACEESRPGVVTFDQVSDGLLAFVAHAARQTLARVLALACSDQLSPAEIWKVLDAGAADVLVSPIDDTKCRSIAARLIRWSQIDATIGSERVAGSLVGRSAAWLATLREVIEASLFSEAPILLIGESGTGKELVARLVHDLDPRTGKRDFVLLDCSTIVPELSGSEFFGHERGAFTGALSQRDGAFAMANGGTLFLDEVGELPPNLQAQLLRVIQERTYKRVGGNTWIKTGFRLVCATNRDLAQLVEAGRFRPDLYYRLASIVIRLPPLRSRPDDILPLARFFMAETRPGDEPPELDDVVREYLLTRAYPGNVRDLKQVISRMMNRYVGVGPVSAGCIAFSDRPTNGCASQRWNGEAFDRCIRHAVELGIGLRDIGRTAEDVAVQIAVTDENGNLQRAAQRLGVTDRALQMRRAAERERLLPAPTPVQPC
jgi:transcriptional regulator with GAF, ATPase, and Fis domain